MPPGDVALEAPFDVPAVDEAAVDEATFEVIAEVLEAAFEVALEVDDIADVVEAAFEVEELADTAEDILEVPPANELVGALEALLLKTAESAEALLLPAAENAENFEFLEVAEEALERVEAAPVAEEAPESAEKGDVLSAALLQLVDNIFFLDKLPAMLGATLICWLPPPATLLTAFIFPLFSDLLFTLACFFLQKHQALKMTSRRSSVPPPMMPPKSMPSPSSVSSSISFSISVKK